MQLVTNASLESPNQMAFGDWTSDRTPVSLGTNAGSAELPFQGWRRFKEAFAPELVAHAVSECPIRVRRCLDPFGGSGTTGLACQFLGVHPIIAEVNPYLADLIEAKLTKYARTEDLFRDLRRVVSESKSETAGAEIERFVSLPPTFVEPGHNGRWILHRQVAERIAAILDAIERLEDEYHRRLFRVLLGGVIVDVSNVVVSGKGRRYRRKWRNRVIPSERVTGLFSVAVRRAINDIQAFGQRLSTSFEVIRGDSRVMLTDVKPCELAVFSPPYPNSFDYTDVYNLELWVLGYLLSRDSNLKLRSATLSSHVQITREFQKPPRGSLALCEVLTRLSSRRVQLWNKRIPEMVGAYFSDLIDVLAMVRTTLVDGGAAWMIVGDSRYAGIQVPVARVVAELAESFGWQVLKVEPVRSMCTSAQQGGERMLSEQLVVLQKQPD